MVDYGGRMAHNGLEDGYCWGFQVDEGIGFGCQVTFCLGFEWACVGFDLHLQWIFLFDFLLQCLILLDPILCIVGKCCMGLILGFGHRKCGLYSFFSLVLVDAPLIEFE